MRSELSIAFSGAGNMAGAIIDAILTAKILSPEKIFVYDTSVDRLSFFKDRGVRICASNSELLLKSNVLVLAVKPQVIFSVLNEIKSLTSGKCIVSIAAGISSESIKNALSIDTHVVRVLPNTPMLIRSGATIIAEPENIPGSYMEFIKNIFEAAGVVTMLPESLINAALPVSSSSPAFFFRMLAAMAKSAEQYGIDYNTALRLAAATMLGSAKLVLNSDKSPGELIRQVSSPGGTTIAALSAFDDIGFEKFIDEVFRRCVYRGEELGRDK